VAKIASLQRTPRKIKIIAFLRRKSEFDPHVLLFQRNDDCICVYASSFPNSMLTTGAAGKKTKEQQVVERMAVVVMI